MNNQNAFKKTNHTLTPRKFALFILSLAVTLVAGGLTASAQNLLTNGDFETGDFTGWTVANQPGGAGDVYISTPGAPSPDFGAFPLVRLFSSIAFSDNLC